MINANHHEIRFEGLLHKFIRNEPELADKAFVTKVYKCAAYARLVTEPEQAGEIYVGYKADNSGEQPSPASSANSGTEGPWVTFSQTGDWTTGTYCADRPSYTPLVTLRQIMPKESANGFRDSLPPAIADEDEMKDYILPWGDLDEQGEEEDPDD